MLITRYKTQARSISMCAAIEREREKEIELQMVQVQPAAAAAILYCRLHQHVTGDAPDATDASIEIDI